MRTIQTKKEYIALSNRIDDLLVLVDNNTSSDDKNFIELDLLSDLVADYEEANEPIKAPTLIEAMKLRMYERGLNQKRLSELLGVSTSRVSEYLTGKSEPPLKTARDISQKLDIDPMIVLGVN
ncbi:helix-turn-helix domain-containing protein [Flavobacterium frigoris]|uniref:HTH-type transcriptional regulator / antitoxin HigA n=1 Tax=Flavobacterium frigoris TaxID=229204 RepID=A0A1H9R0Q7_FLAFI|nr:helix-turn-helix domain-containing protein [Flavobacterium frigoris]SER66095.1 HTH-type transcriptional regulator / antitoxin HigA [Flavobacterium frigoris]